MITELPVLAAGVIAVVVPYFSVYILYIRKGQWIKITSLILTTACGLVSSFILSLIVDLSSIIIVCIYL